LFGPDGNPDCWDSGFNADLCCNPPRQVEVLEQVYADRVYGDAERVYVDMALSLDDFHSTVTEELSPETVSETRRTIGNLCEWSWKFELSSESGMFRSKYLEFSGLPLSRMPHGWDGTRDGQAGPCLSEGYRFYLVELSFVTLQATDAYVEEKTHFGICAPAACNTDDVAGDLAPHYALSVMNALRAYAVVRSVRAWEWPQFLNEVKDSGTFKKQALQESIEYVQLKTCEIGLALLTCLLLGTSCDYAFGEAMGKRLTLTKAMGLG
jgi:hypothetical protein